MRRNLALALGVVLFVGCLAAAQSACEWRKAEIAWPGQCYGPVSMLTAANGGHAWRLKVAEGWFLFLWPQTHLLVAFGGHYWTLPLGDRS